MDTVSFIANQFDIDIYAPPPLFITINRKNGFPKLLCDLGFKVGAEVGVERGLYSEILCQKIPGLKLYSIDSWQFYSGYRTHVSQEELDGFYVDTHERLDPYGVTIMREFSTEAAKRFEDGSLDFVYIDSNHDFLHVTEDIAAWSPKVRPGGIVSGHDYRHRNGCHVKDVVQAWAYCYSIRPWFVMANDRSPSWFWVVPGDQRTDPNG